MHKVDLKRALTAIEPKTKAAKVREVMPVIEQRIAAGVRIADTVKTLQDSGIDLTEATLKSYLYRHRKKKRKTIGRQSSPTSSSPSDFPKHTVAIRKVFTDHIRLIFRPNHGPPHCRLGGPSLSTVRSLRIISSQYRIHMKKGVSTSTADRTLLFVLAISVFFVGASEFMLSAMLNPLSVAFETDSVRVAWLISSYAFAYAIAAPLLGYMSDRINRSRLLLIALLSFAIDSIGIAFSPTLEIAIALRVFGGLASAVIIPTSFALIAEVIPRARHASAMGTVMLGMTFGIALGPAMAGILTTYIGWRTPFLLTAIGCIAAFLIGTLTMPRRRATVAARETRGFAWLGNWKVTRPLLAKSAWNGTAVSAFLLSGEVLRQRYQLDVAHIGVSVTAFGVGLGIGNLSAGRLRRCFGSEERSLIGVTTVLAVSVAAFYLLPLPLSGALVCLTIWAAAMGAGAPSSTTVLAERSGQCKGVVLASAETLNNLVILAVVPVASISLANGQIAMAMAVFGIGLGLGSVLTLYDAAVAPMRNQ